MSLAFEPFQDFVLIEPIPEDETSGGLVLPEGVNPDGVAKAKVVKVGPGRLLDSGEVASPCVAEGDIVYQVIVHFQPLPIKLDKKDYLLVRERDLVARVAEA